MIRLAVIGALLTPTLLYIGAYWWTNRTLDGLIEALSLSAIDSIITLLDYALTHPLHALLFFLVTWGMGKIAFR